MKHLNTAKELVSFLAGNKKWWLLPVVTILLGLGMILVFAGTSALAPFIYTMF